MGMMNQPTALEHILITTKVEKIINWSRATSVWPMTFGLACCAIEMMAAGAPGSTSTGSGPGSSGPPPARAT